MSQHCFSICYSGVSAYVPALFQHMFQHCVSAYVTTLFQHMFQHCFTYVLALCFICSSTVFQHMLLCFNICYCVSSYVTTLCFSICSNPVSAYVPTLCFSICYSTVSSYIPALFQHMFQHCFSICSSTGFGLVPFFAICMLPFGLRLVKVDPPWLAGRFPTCVLVPA
jgi:hypothetical protein